jgi:uncharacterized protein
MHRQILTSAVVGFVMMIVCPNAALAQSSDPQFRADIERLLDVTGAAKVGAQMASLVADSVIDGLKRSGPAIPDRAFTIVKEVLDTEFSNMYTAPDGVLPDMVELYVKHFTHDDVLALLEFYRSPVGQKAIVVMPLLVQEGAAIGQRWMEPRMPKIMDTLQQRLRAEGLFK